MAVAALAAAILIDWKVIRSRDRDLSHKFHEPKGIESRSPKFCDLGSWILKTRAKWSRDFNFVP